MKSSTKTEVADLGSDAEANKDGSNAEPQAILLGRLFPQNYPLIYTPPNDSEIPKHIGHRC